jgi:hypothetical protein
MVSHKVYKLRVRITDDVDFVSRQAPKACADCFILGFSFCKMTANVPLR